MIKEIESIDEPSTTNLENRELFDTDDESIDEGIECDPVENCFKELFGVEEFDNSITFAPYSKIPLEAKSSTSDKEKLASTPITYDSVSIAFLSFLFVLLR